MRKLYHFDQEPANRQSREKCSSDPHQMEEEEEKVLPICKILRVSASMIGLLNELFRSSNLEPHVYKLKIKVVWLTP